MSCDLDPAQCPTKTLCMPATPRPDGNFTWSYSCVKCQSCVTVKGERPDPNKGAVNTGSASATDEVDCCKQCRARTDCQVGNWNPEGKNKCYFWDKVTDYIDDQPNATSCIVEGKRLPPYTCLTYPGKRPDPTKGAINTGQASATDAQTCCKQCTANSECEVGNWNPEGKNVCYFWNKVTDYITDQPNATSVVTSGATPPK